MSATEQLVYRVTIECERPGCYQSAHQSKIVTRRALTQVLAAWRDGPVRTRVVKVEQATLQPWEDVTSEFL